MVGESAIGVGISLLDLFSIGALVDVGVDGLACFSGEVVGSIRANASVEVIEGAAVSLTKPTDEGAPFNEISSHALRTFGSLK